MKFKIIIIGVVFAISFNLLGQEVSIRKAVRNEDFVVSFNNSDFRISQKGFVTYKEFSAKLFDYDSLPWYEAGLYTGLVYKDYLIADMVVDAEYGGMRFYLFANYNTNKIFFIRNIADEPVGFRSAVGKDNFIVLIFGREAVCYDLTTEKILWHEIWSDGSSKSKLTHSLKNFEANDKNIVITLRSNKKLYLDYKTGLKQ